MEVKKKQWATVEQNKDFIAFITYSGYRSSAADPEGLRIHLESTASDEDLGEATLKVLSRSRFLQPDQLQFFAPDQLKKNYDAWKQDVMNQYGYKNLKELFTSMMHVSVEVCDGQMTFRPSHQEKLEGWGASQNYPNDQITIPADSSPEEIGKALRLSISHCTSKFN